MQKIIKYTKEALEKVKPTLTEGERMFITEHENKSTKKEYTIVEFVDLLDKGKWSGGHVQGLGYVPADMFTKIESDDSNIDIFVPNDSFGSWPEVPGPDITGPVIPVPGEPEDTSEIPALSDITNIDTIKSVISCFSIGVAEFQLSGVIVRMNDYYYSIAYNSKKNERYYAYSDIYVFLKLEGRYAPTQYKIMGFIPAHFNFEQRTLGVGVSLSLNEDEKKSFSLSVLFCAGGTTEYNEAYLIAKQEIFRSNN